MERALRAGRRQVIELGQELDEPDGARVRVRDGERLVTDGPYAETKEQIGGIFVVEADDLDHAISVAARIPVAERLGRDQAARRRSSG